MQLRISSWICCFVIIFSASNSASIIVSISGREVCNKFIYFYFLNFKYFLIIFGFRNSAAECVHNFCSDLWIFNWIFCNPLFLLFVQITSDEPKRPNHWDNRVWISILFDSIWLNGTQWPTKSWLKTFGIEKKKRKNKRKKKTFDKYSSISEMVSQFCTQRKNEKKDENFVTNTKSTMKVFKLTFSWMI